MGHHYVHANFYKSIMQCPIWDILGIHTAAKGVDGITLDVHKQAILALRAERVLKVLIESARARERAREQRERERKSERERERERERESKRRGERRREKKIRERERVR